jgi:hypothetical protein
MRTWHTALAVALLAAACGPTMEVDSDFNPAIDFSRYKTWNFIETRATGPNVAQINDLVKQRIEGKIEAVMATKGFMRQMGGAPDFYLAYHGTSETKYDVTTQGYSYGGWGGGWGGYYGGGVRMGTATTHVDQYKQGTLVLDIIDGKERALVWRGTASDAVRSQEEAREKIDEAITEILAEFPPRKS